MTHPTRTATNALPKSIRGTTMKSIFSIRYLLLPAALLALTVMLAPQVVHAQATRNWSSNGTSSIAWLTVGNWSGAIFAGGAPLENPSGEGAITDIMGFTTGSTGTTAGINMNSLDNSTLVGQLILGGIDFNRTSSNAFQIGNSSSTISGILQLNGATINSVANTLIRVNSGNMTIQNVSTGATNGC